MQEIKAISLNPYRVVGALASFSKKEIVANITRIKANLRVGRTVEFESDLLSILPPINRNNENISSAESELTLFEGQIKHSQFWFFSKTELDKVAISNLAAGNIQQAYSIWEKKDNVSSIQNRIVCSLIKNDFKTAITLAEKLYCNYEDELGDLFDAEHINSIKSDLAHSFLAQLCEEVEPSFILSHVTNMQWRESLIDVAAGPIIDKIEQAIAVAKSTKKAGPNERLKVGTTLMAVAINSIGELKRILTPSNVKYSVLADKLGLEILQCGIDYYNGSDDINAAHKAYKLQKYASSVVVGKMAKDRCGENLSILDDIISKLPPAELLSSHSAIQKALQKHSRNADDISAAITLMKECAEHIVNVKSALGVQHQYYLSISTKIVNRVLSSIIDIVNSTLKNDSDSFVAVKTVLTEAWRATLYMDKFDMESPFRISRYKPNRDSLYNLIDRVKGFEPSHLSYRYQYGCGFCNDIDVSDLDLSSDDEMFAKCKSITSCKKYINRFPNGKHIDEVQHQLLELEFKNCKTIADYERFIASCPDASLKKKAISGLTKLKKELALQQELDKAHEKALAGCTSLEQVIALFNKERTRKICVDKCSGRAFDLCSSENQYKQLIDVFGSSSFGGRKARQKLEEIEKRRKEYEVKMRKVRKVALIISIPLLIFLTIFLIWGFQGLSGTLNILAIIAGFFAFSALKSGDGCALFLISLAIAGVLGAAGAGLSSLAEQERIEEEIEEEYHKIKANPSSQQCEEYIREYPNSKYLDEVRRIWLNQLVNAAKSYDYSASRSYYSTQTPFEELVAFANDNSNKYGTEARQHLGEIRDSLYNIANTLATVDAWKAYQKALPSAYWKDSKKKIQEIENQKWSTESKAWNTAKSEDTIAAYQKYLELYPKGKHRSQAEKKLIDLEVAGVFAGSHGSLPAMDKTNWGSGPTSHIYVTNSTGYTLTLLYSGPDSKKLVLSPGRSSSIDLKNGNYKVAASVSASHVNRYAGSESLTGGSYSVEYYISSHSF